MAERMFDDTTNVYFLCGHRKEEMSFYIESYSRLCVQKLTGRTSGDDTLV